MRRRRSYPAITSLSIFFSFGIRAVLNFAQNSAR